MANKNKVVIKDKQFGYLMITVISVFIGLAFLTAIGQAITPLRKPYTIVNESLDISAARLADNNINESYGFSLNNDNWVSSSVKVYNETKGELTANTDYIVNYTEEKIYFKNSTTMVNYVSNTTLIDYQYYDDRYIEDTTGRALLGIITLLVIVGILSVALVPVIKSWLVRKYS